MRRCIPQPLNVLFTGFAIQVGIELFRNVRLRVSVDVSEHPAKPNVDPVVFPGISLRSMFQDALTNPGLHLLRYLDTTRLRIVDPNLSWHQRVPPLPI